MIPVIFSAGGALRACDNDLLPEPEDRNVRHWMRVELGTILMKSQLPRKRSPILQKSRAQFDAQPVSSVQVCSARQSVVVLGEHTASRADGQRRDHCGCVVSALLCRQTCQCTKSHALQLLIIILG